MVTVSNATLRQNVWETLYDIIKAISFSTTDSVTVTAAYDAEDHTLPVVAIWPVDVDIDQFSFGSTNSTKTLKILIDVWTKKNKDQDVIADELMDVLGDRTYSGFFLVGVESSNALEINQDVKQRLKSITMTFMRR